MALGDVGAHPLRRQRHPTAYSVGVSDEASPVLPHIASADEPYSICRAHRR